MTIKCGRRQYAITERDLFMDNGCCAQLLTQYGPLAGWHETTPILPKREIKRIGMLSHVQHPHKYGELVKVFSLRNKPGERPETRSEDV